MEKGEEKTNMISSTHNHSTGSDGKLSPEELIEKAIELGWDYVYFTDHFLNPKKAGIIYEDDNYFNNNYINEIKHLKEKYKDKIEVCFGVELGWLNSYEKWLKEQSKKYNFDYVIGSIHDIIDKNKKPHSMESGKENWLKSAKSFGGIEEFVKEYYKQIKLLIKSKIFDSVGHLDYIKVYNREQDLFSEKADWYKKEVLSVLDLIKKNKIALEINHGGIRKCKAAFPSLWILKEAKKRNIPITLGIDAHLAEHLNNKIMNQLIQIAKQTGYDSVVRFKDRKMIVLSPNIISPLYFIPFILFIHILLTSKTLLILIPVFSFL